MRWLGLVLLAGCAQVFGLDHPRPLGDAAPDTTSDSAPDAAGRFAPCRQGDDGLVGCFDFEGTVTDASSSHLSVLASRVSFGAGQLGMAGVFDPNSTATIAETPALDLSSFTVEMWVNLAALPASGTRMGLFDNDTQYGMFVIAGGILECNASNGATLQGATLVANEWTHVACTDDGATLVQYVNGSKVAEAGVAPPTTTGTNGSAIGGNAPSGDPMAGSLDLLRIYGLARTRAQICADAGCP